ncbi:XRE family transcriptional regulator [Streptomyces sp. WAC04770]|nr:XRE family transcriptional regulator [Streptomyces sp. WAC04770]RST17377.1 XRE family transcriptional regulator [Streptomyces sp. WAC04770]
MTEEVNTVIQAIGPRLRRLRRRASLTLTTVSETTGIPISTLSRLESGQRKPGLELLLPLAPAYRVPLDELVQDPAGEDPRLQRRPIRRGTMTIIPLTNKPGGLQAYKHILDADASAGEPTLRSHEGYHWLYVLKGKLRLILGEKDLVLRPGEVAEFDTHLPHWYGSAEAETVEYLSILGPQGERFHVKAHPQPSQ